MSLSWRWEPQGQDHANFGNANQWTVNAGLQSLARESLQNSNDARLETERTPALHFTFHLLDGVHRQQFLDAIKWTDELDPHLAAIADQSGGAVAAGGIRAGLNTVRSSPSLLLLSVADYGCRGLTGPERADIDPDDYGNFIKLCKADLFSGKDGAAGGSFGLGKAVYWRFSSIQTVLFNSVLAAGDAVEGRTCNRLFGVNQGVAHRYGHRSFKGRGYFGSLNSEGHIESAWLSEASADALHVAREDPRPGTTALLIGFQDPDEPELATRGIAGVRRMAEDLRQGVEENFWPLLARGKMEVRIGIRENDSKEELVTVDPEETYTELVRALRRFDSGDLDEQLDEPYSVIARPISIDVPRRSRSEPAHDAFVHTAQLVLTISDQQKDTLENKVCLFRQPEMVVETIDKEFDGMTYHGFLVVGGAITPGDAGISDRMADDFLRFAEPPAHDRWIPRGGRGKTSQSSLGAHYMPPWNPNLLNIAQRVQAELFKVFGAPPPTDGEPPKAVFKHLQFLVGGDGKGGSGSSRTAKPAVLIKSHEVERGRWKVRFQLRAKNRPEGWDLEPLLAFIGLDGKAATIAWETLQSPDSNIEDGVVRIASKERGRFISATVDGVSTDVLPIPAEEATVDIQVRDHTDLGRPVIK